MSGVIDEDGTQWEHCNGCGEFVRIDDLLYAKIRPELIAVREARIDAWVAEAEASPMVECELCDGTGTRTDEPPKDREVVPASWLPGGCNGCRGTGQRHEIWPRGRGPAITADELLDLCSECALPDTVEHVGPAATITLSDSDPVVVVAAPGAVVVAPGDSVGQVFRFGVTVTLRPEWVEACFPEQPDLFWEHVRDELEKLAASMKDEFGLEIESMEVTG